MNLREIRRDWKNFDGRLKISVSMNLAEITFIAAAGN